MQEVEEMILVTLEEAGADGISINGLKRRTAGTRTFGMLVDLGVQQLMDDGKIKVEKRPPRGGGRGRPQRVIVKSS